MKMQKKIETVTKELVSTEGFENLKVKTICEKTSISRKTFYTFYKDKFDVIESIFYNEVFLYATQIYELFGDVREITPHVLEKMYQRYFNDRDFYTKVFGLKGERTLEECITYHLNVFNQKLLEKRDMSSYEKEYLSYYFAASQMIIIKKWIEDGMILSPKEIAEIHQELINDAFLKNYYPNKK